MRKWWHWLISPRRSFLNWLAERQAALERERTQEQQRLEQIAKEAEQASEQAARETLERELARLAPARHALAADKMGTPLLLCAYLGPSLLEARAITAYGSCAHLEMTLQASLCEEVAELLDMHGVSHNRGVGTALLQFTEPILREMGARQVRGTLRYSDEEHLARLLRFFIKNGYRLVETEEGLAVEKRLP